MDPLGILAGLTMFEILALSKFCDANSFTAQSIILVFFSGSKFKKVVVGIISPPL